MKRFSIVFFLIIISAAIALAQSSRGIVSGTPIETFGNDTTLTALRMTVFASVQMRG